MSEISIVAVTALILTLITLPLSGSAAVLGGLYLSWVFFTA